MISVDAYPFFVFTDLTCQLENTRIMFSGCTVLPEVFGSSNQEACPSPGKNTRIVLVPCHSWKCVPTAISGGVDISKVTGCHLFRQMSCQCRS